MVSIRRLCFSKIWAVRRSKWLIILFILILTVAARILVQAGARLLENPSLYHESTKHFGGFTEEIQRKSLNQKNYKLTWLGRKDSHRDINAKQNEYRGGKTNREKSPLLQEWKSSRPLETKRKFLFVFRYYEQLGRATSNLLALASWAKFRNSYFVAPYVNNSRMSGLPGGVSHFLRETSTSKFAPLGTYYDINKLNESLKNHGYGTVATLDELENECNHRLHIVVHFLYSDSDDLKDAAEWYRKSYTEMQSIYRKAQSNGGWLPCPFVRHSRLQKQLRFKVSRFVCVDPHIIRSPWELEEKVIQGRQCVGVVLWKGTGKGRTHFPIHPSISHPLIPSDVPFNPFLLNLARKFIREKIGSSFLAVHVRIERHYMRLGMNVTYRCMKKLVRRVLEAHQRFRTTKLFLASDLPQYGSDTFKEQSSNRKDREVLLKYLVKHLNNPIMYKPTEMYDTGAIAIIEMNIVAAGKKLYTLGGGNFQDWIINLFLKKPSKTKRDVHRLCELT